MTDQADAQDVKRVVEQGYDRVALDYARLEGDREWPRLRWLRKMLNRLEPGSHVLDLGCGSGDPAGIEIAQQHRVTGVDISQAQIDLARQNVPSGRFIHGDAASIEFPAASFDAAVSFYTLEHIPRQEHKGTLERIHHALYVATREQEGREASPTAAIIDSQSAKAAQRALGSTRRASMRARRLRAASGMSLSTRSDCS